MKLHIFSYRYAEEILQHPNNLAAWNEIESILCDAPIFIYPGKSKNARLQIVQQLMNTYFDRRFAVDCGWDYHPLATGIAESGLAADFRKTFGKITIQAEVQFGNMARWYLRHLQTSGRLFTIPYSMWSLCSSYRGDGQNDGFQCGAL